MPFRCKLQTYLESITFKNNKKKPIITKQKTTTAKKYINLNNFRKYIDGGLDNKEGCFTIIDKEINKIIETTRYYSFNQEELSIKIGYTFISQHYWGTHMNYQIKKLMLDYIFQYFDKVYFYIWKTNYRSQKSVEKFGGEKLSLKKNNKYLYLIEKKVWKNIISTQS